jgi:hypothetical protein
MNAPHPLAAGALFCAAAALLTACAKDPIAASPPGTAPPPASVAIPAASSAAPIAIAPPVAIALVPRRFERARLTFDGLAEIEPDLVNWDVGGVFQQARRLVGNEDRFEILVRAHGDETLAGFERDHSSATLSRRSSLQICGRNAEMVRATRPEQFIACVMVEAPGQNHPAYVPPSEDVAVAFEHDKLGVVLSIEITAADPAAYRPVVDRILASIRCL